MAAPLTTYGPLTFGRVNTSIAIDSLSLIKNAGACGALFISEYIQDTVHNDDAIEIYNPTSGMINLNHYYLMGTINGSSAATFMIQLNGKIAPYKTFVVANSNADTALIHKANQLSGSLNFKGIDLVGLAYIYLNGVYVLDKIGI